MEKIISVLFYDVYIYLDVYWVDFNCFLPQNAIAGGYDRYGRETYIGQAFVTNGAIVPVSVQNGNCSVNAAYNYVQSTSLYNKVKLIVDF